MLKVWKWPIPWRGTDVEFSLNMPYDARFLSVQVQHGEPQLWALVDPESRTEQRWFLMTGTGIPIRESPQALKHIGTVLLLEGDMVLHIFEILGES